MKLLHLHSKEVADSLVQVSQVLFGNSSLTDLNEKEIAIVKENAPCVRVPEDSSIVDVLVQAKLATSKREARTFIESGAVQINGNKIDTTDAKITKDLCGDLCLIKRGKKSVSLVERT